MYLQFVLPSGSPGILVFPTKLHGTIPTGTPPKMGVEVGMKNGDFRPISRFIPEMMQDTAIVTMEDE